MIMRLLLVVMMTTFIAMVTTPKKMLELIRFGDYHDHVDDGSGFDKYNQDEKDDGETADGNDKDCC